MAGIIIVSFGTSAVALVGWPVIFRSPRQSTRNKMDFMIFSKLGVINWRIFRLLSALICCIARASHVHSSSQRDHRLFARPISSSFDPHSCTTESDEMTVDY